LGSSADAASRQLQNQANIGRVSHEQALARRGLPSDVQPADIHNASISLYLTSLGKLLCSALADVLCQEWHSGGSSERGKARKQSNGSGEYEGGCIKSQEAWRVAFCSQCSEVIVADADRGKNFKHPCVFGKDLTLVEATSPDMKRLLYPHDILNDPVLNSLARSENEAFSALNIIQFDACKILGNAQLENDLPPADYQSVTGSIYVQARDQDDMDWKLTLAFDVALIELSEFTQCPLQPSNAKSRFQVWQPQVQGRLLRAMVGDGYSVHIVTCDHDSWKLHISEPLSEDRAQHILIACDRNKALISSDERKVEREANGSTARDEGTRKCGTQYFYNLSTFFELPMDFQRRIWYHQRLQDTTMDNLVTWGL
jgi:hypothetical protein